MSRLPFIVAIAAIVACGDSTTRAALLPPEDPIVRIQVAVPAMYKGFPLTITAEPLPVPVETTALGSLPNQYEIDLTPEELTGATFQVLSYNPAEHSGNIVGDVDLLAELARFDLHKNGTPSVVAFLLVTSSPASPQQIIPPRIDTILVEWPDGQKSSFVYN